uniref:Serine aminopeptidase S33 domain-containing protein n=1 Tax=Alexandrium catenella TaxID=2925 RepID=A0A7S1QTS8_ALECA|mmetsp:Transcript_38538/g.104387  ORF Transcript_38538/g.104387 Transcript_38538/m.104387 type:complete len:407 (+) Transcript_38538:21-1241(+)
MGCGTSRGADVGFVNKLLFPAPEASSYASWSFKGELLWVPLAQYRSLGEGSLHSTADDYAFPCRLLQCGSAEYLIVFFHKNADDLGSCKPFVEKLRSCLGVHVLVVEYPGYGLCSSSSNASAQQVNKHAFAAVEFAQTVLGVPLRRIIIFGSCIGTGPAIAVAAEVEVAGLVLISPFLSVVQIFRLHIGSVLSKLISEQFQNDVLIKSVRSPTLICHGKMDKLVPFIHAEQLYKSLPCKAKLVDSEDANHHTNLMQDERQFVAPMRDFFNLPGSSLTDGLRVPAWAFQRRRHSDRVLLAKEAAQLDRMEASNSLEQLASPKVEVCTANGPPSGTRASDEVSDADACSLKANSGIGTPCSQRLGETPCGGDMAQRGLLSQPELGCGHGLEALLKILRHGCGLLSCRG